MDGKEFILTAQKFIEDYHNERIAGEGSDIRKIEWREVFVVWQVKVLQNWKALLSTPVNDGMYYEVTYNGNTQEFYFDAYEKQSNFAVQRKISLF